MIDPTRRHICEISHSFHARGWVLGTSGNFSAVISREPLRLAVTASGLDKGELKPEQILEVGDDGRKIGDRPGKPSDETLVHLEVVRSRGAGAVLHTHSIWSTMLTDRFAEDRGLAIENYEMLKGLDGVRTHEHREWLPILENDQDMRALAQTVGSVLQSNPQAHGFLLRRHGLYTWGVDLQQAKRHVEILEFLLEVIGRGVIHGNTSHS